MLNKLIDFLSGKKTYLTALAVVVIGVAEGVFHKNIPGVVVGPNWLEWILSGTGLASVRAAIAKVQ